MSELRLKLSEYGGGKFFGTRHLGAQIRADAEGMLAEQPGKQVVLDFGGVKACTITFVDELVANLCAKYGNRIQVASIDDEIASAIEIALSRRDMP